MILFAANVAPTVAAKVANAFEWPGQPTKIASSSLDFVTLPEEDRATAIGMYVCMYVSFAKVSSVLWTHTLRPFYSRPIALTMEGGEESG